MEELDDLLVTLKPAYVSDSDSRRLRIGLSSRVNFSNYSLQSFFQFNSNAVNSVEVDPADPTGLIVSMRKEIVLPPSEDEVAISYYATSGTGEATGKVRFPGLDFELSAAPINYDFEYDPCSKYKVPDKIIIDVSEFNQGGVELEEVGTNNTDAGTISLSDAEGNDYDSDYNDDYGTTARRLITYELNKEEDFWNSLPAEDSFSYTISKGSKTATNFITIRVNRFLNQ